MVLSETSRLLLRLSGLVPIALISVLISSLI